MTESHPFPGPIPKADRAGTMVELLRAAGVSDEEIEVAAEHDHLALLCVERLVLPDRLDRDLFEISEATGLEPDLVRQIRRSLGFVEASPSDRLYGDVDVEVLEAIGELLDTGLVDVDLVVQMARVIGSSTARIASALLDVIDPNIPEPEQVEGDVGTVDGEEADEGAEAASEPSARLVDSDQFAEIAPQVFPMIMQVIDYVWSRHLHVEARARMARDISGTATEGQVVGFADLVGFTALSQALSTLELAALVDRFETIAYDVVGRLGGRVVKMIGDEVMFTVDDERVGAEIALALSDAFREEHGLAEVRIGLASGPVLQREADLFGPVVNRASRIVSLANPGSILCDEAVAAALADDDAYRLRSLGRRKLKNMGKVPVHVLRRAEHR